MGLFSKPKAEPIAEAPALPREEPLTAPAPARTGGTVIAQGITVTGKLTGEGVIQVEGTVEGEFDLTGAVIVSETGVVRGPIRANVVRVSGRVEGSIYALEHTRLESTGSLEGDVSTASLVVEDGGSFNGRCTMLATPAPEPELEEVAAPKELQFGPEFDLEEAK